jgi:hypothetical protein
MKNDDALAIKVSTENRQRHARISEQGLRELVRRIGGPGDRFLVVQRIPDIPDVFIQVWHPDGGDYRLEYRDSREHFYGTDLADPDRVADAMVAWARRQEGWQAGADWEPVPMGPADDVPELPADVRSEVEAHIGELLRCGYGDRAQLAEDAEEWLVKGDERPVSAAQARQLVDRLWLERVREQETWEGLTDPDRLTRAFEALDSDGITARENFTCCRTCGTAEIGGESREGARGFVYFHTQCTESAAAGHGLMLLYGGFDGSDGTTAAVGRAVVDALDAAGLSTEWDGTPESAITVTPLDWRKRLVG